MNKLNATTQPGDTVKPLPKSAVIDLQSQLEALLDTVWESEANWRLDDRIDLATKPRRPGR